MNHKAKVKYDKTLSKYHIEYHKVPDITSYRYDLLKKLSDRHDLLLWVDTTLGATHKIQPEEFARKTERDLSDLSLSYAIKSFQGGNPKLILGFLGNRNATENHFAILIHLPKASLTQDIFNRLFTEMDLQISYEITTPLDTIFDDFRKGYLNQASDAKYFGQSLFDSRIFNKFLASEDISL